MTNDDYLREQVCAAVEHEVADVSDGPRGPWCSWGQGYTTYALRVPPFDDSPIEMIAHAFSDQVASDLGGMDRVEWRVRPSIMEHDNGWRTVRCRLAAEWNGKGPRSPIVKAEGDEAVVLMGRTIMAPIERGDLS